MYISKWFTCEEIDERLKQGYYDDFVSAGFVGTLQEFLAFVLSIQDKPGNSEVRAALDALEEKLKGLIDGVQDNLDTTETELNDRIDQEVQTLEEKLEAQKVTKVSQLENDANYQTEEQVKAYISALVNGADESLDTLLELAEALGNDPNFAATVTEKLGNLKNAIDEEAQRAQDKEAELKTALETETAKREEGDANVLKLAEQHIDRIDQALQQAFNNLDQKVQTLNAQYQAILQSFHDLSVEVNTKIEEAKQEAKDDNAALKAELEKILQDSNSGLDEKIEAEITRATEAERLLDSRIDALTKTHTDDVASLNTNISDNQKAIQKEVNDRTLADNALDTKISKEQSDRTTADADLQAKISQESLNRLQGDNALDTKITKEISDRQTADTSLQSQINEEKTSRESGDIQLSKDLEQMLFLHNNDVKDLTDAVAAEVTRAKSVEETKVDKVEGKDLSSNDFTDALKAKLENIQEQANYITKVSELINDSGYQTLDEVKTEIQKIIGSAPDVLDTLQEIAEALDNDPNFAGTMMNRMAALGTQLNEEVENRTKADDTLRLELLAKIAEVTNNMGNSYDILEERLNTYKTLSDSKDQELQSQINTLENLLNSKVEFFISEVTKLSDKYNEKLVEINTKVNEFTVEIMARITAQDALIRENTAGIQRNLELLQKLTTDFDALRGVVNGNFTELLQAIQDEANTRKAADDALSARVDANTEAIDKDRAVLEALDAFVKDNLSSNNIVGSDTIKVEKSIDEEGIPTTTLSVIVPADEKILVADTTGIKTVLGIEKTQDEEKSIYKLTGNDGTPLEGVIPIDVPKNSPFTEQEAQDMFSSIYGEANSN